MAGVGTAGAMILLSFAIDDRIAASLVLTLGFAVSDVMVPVAWAVSVDVGRDASGTISGAMNTAGQLGGVIMSVGYGALVDSYGWNLPSVSLPARASYRCCSGSRSTRPNPWCRHATNRPRRWLRAVQR